MRALVLNQPDDFEVRDVEAPVPGFGQVLVRIHACGLCGTDIHIVKGEFPPTPFPITPGHESAGEIVELGQGVSGLSVGDRVGIDAGLSCGQCELCRGGSSNVCPHRGGIGGTVNGGFAELAVVPAKNCFPFAAHLSYGEAAVAEPLSCVLHGLQLLRPTFQPTVLVLGAGTMGLLSLQAMKAAGALTVDLANRSAARLPLARELGADRALSAADAELADARYDIVIEATGAPSMVSLGLKSLKPRGQLLLLGVTPVGETVALSPFELYDNELTVLASMGARDTYGKALSAIANGTIRVDPLITHSFPLDGFAEALSVVAAGAGVKVQITPQTGSSDSSGTMLGHV